MEPNFQRKGLVNAVLLLTLGVASAAVAHYANSATGLVGAAFLGLGVLVGALSYFQMGLEERERLEQLEFDELQRSPASATLFAERAGDNFPARRAREQFEKYFVPAFACGLLLLQGIGAYLLWRSLATDQPASPQQATVAMTFFGLFALIFFQFGQYSAVLARLERQRLLRPAGSYLLLGSVLSFLAAVTEVAGWAGYPHVDVLVARILVILLGLVALENLLTLVFELYRPRVRGQAEHPLYESRLIGLLGQPGGLITTAAQALDYQFGFKVSETWFYRFLERALAWIILLQFAVLLLSTCVVFLDPGEQALLERFGKPVAGRPVLGPGAHLKLPWPIDKVYRYQTDLVQSFQLGIETDQDIEAQRVLLWTKSHAKKEYDMLVASGATEPESPTGERTVPVNLLAVDIPVQYQIKDLPAFAYKHANAQDLLERVANAEVSRYLVNVDINEIMTTGRFKAAEELRQRIQRQADAHQLGVKILFVGLQGIHPPVKVAPDYERVIGAMQERETTNLYARAYLAERVPLARAEATELTNRAEVYRIQTTADAGGAATRFTNQLAAYHASPAVYKMRAYLETLGRSIAATRKYVVMPTNTHDVVMIDLQDKIREDILNELRIKPTTPTTSTNR